MAWRIFRQAIYFLVNNNRFFLLLSEIIPTFAFQL